VAQSTWPSQLAHDIIDGGKVMAQRLKRWESPRKAGRNDKGRGGSARQRQRKKQFKVLKKSLTENSKSSKSNQDSVHSTEYEQGREVILSLLFLMERVA
jgi:hypothetical protein